MRRFAAFLAFTTAVVIVLATLPAGAITNGQIDGDRHPNVGVIGCRTSEGVITATGTVELVSPTVVLTAAHVIDFQPVEGCRSRFFVSFDPAFDPETSPRFAVTELAKHPQFNPITRFNDVGVLILKKPVRGITPAELPTGGLLDELKLAGAIQDYSFVTVGYGAHLDCSTAPPGSPWCDLVFDDTRRFATVSYNGHSADFITLQMNATATGEGGFCAGDSGGANFLGGPDSNLIVGVTSVASTCLSVGYAQRLDTPSVRAFLDEFLP